VVVQTASREYGFVMKAILIFLAMLVMVAGVTAIPTTGAATNVTSNSVNLSASGITGTGWFEYGLTTGYLSWKSPNTTVTGTMTRILYGSPLMGGQTFYYKVCDTTGCGNELSFSLAAVTPAPQTTFGYVYQNVTETGFDPIAITNNAIQPYIWVAPISVIWGLVFLFIFSALWLRGRDVTVPTILGLICGFVLFNPVYGMTLHPDFIGMSQGLAYASCAGIVFSIFKK
jgi:hypothetical protein